MSGLRSNLYEICQVVSSLCVAETGIVVVMNEYDYVYTRATPTVLCSQD